MKKYLSIIKRSSLFAGISEEKILEMLEGLPSKITDFEKGSYILMTGDHTDSLGVLLEGKALIIQEDFWGSRNIISTIQEGQCFGESFASAPGSVLNVSVVAEKQCKVLFLNVKEILAMNQEQFLKNLLSDMAYKNLHFSQKLIHLGQRTTRAKLLSYLSAEAKRQGSFEFDLPFTKQQLADYLFVERSGLSMEFSKMQKDGLIEFQKNHIILKVNS